MFALDQEHRHHWWPVSPMSHISVEMERPDLCWTGRAYFDSNAGTGPLEKSFSDWDWSRSTNGHGTRILYDVRGAGDTGVSDALSLYVHKNGDIDQRLVPPRQRLARGMWQVGRSTRADENAPARVTRTLEDTPFYTRSMITSCIDGAPVESMHESLSLDRFNRKWVQTLLPFRMPRF